MAKKKPEPPPNIDLHAAFLVIDLTADGARWRMLDEGAATRENAKRCARKHGVPGVWIVDQLGYKEYVTA